MFPVTHCWNASVRPSAVQDSTSPSPPALLVIGRPSPGWARCPVRRRSTERQPLSTEVRRYCSALPVSDRWNQRRYRPQNASWTTSSALGRSPSMMWAIRISPSA